jgi:hypothetical protein
MYTITSLFPILRGVVVLLREGKGLFTERNFVLRGLLEYMRRRNRPTHPPPPASPLRARGPAAGYNPVNAVPPPYKDIPYAPT